ncbi:hypothetical protein Hanom_Chr00s010041g01744401 [Helianthus anomalus]
MPTYRCTNSHKYHFKPTLVVNPNVSHGSRIRPLQIVTIDWKFGKRISACTL